MPGWQKYCFSYRLFDILSHHVTSAGTASELPGAPVQPGRACMIQTVILHTFP